MADGAVLAHDVLVLEHDAGAGAVVRAGIGPAGEVDDLVGLDAGRARIDRVGADAGEVVDLPGGDGAVALDADLRLDAMVAGVDVGDEALDAVGDELDRTLEQLRKRDHRHLVGIGMHLDPERTAHILGHDADLMLLEAEMLGEQVLHHVRRLGAVIDGEALLARIPIGDDGARFVGDAGVATEHEGRLHHRVGILEALVGIAGDVHALEREIVAELGMDDRRSGIERGFSVGDRRQFLVAHLHELARVLGLGAAARDHGADRLALPARSLDGDRVLRRGFDPFQVREHADPRRDHRRELRAGDDGDHAGCRFRSRGGDPLDARMGVGRAHEGHMRHTRQRQIAHELGAAAREAREIGARDRPADIGVRPVQGGENGRRIVRDFHVRICFPSALACATASTASTMAW